LFWDQFLDGNTGNDFVTQNYNSKNDPTNGQQGKNILLNTHATWNNVATSNFSFVYGDDTGRCPSLVLECKGPQKFDGNNDVAWLKINDPTVLGVTWHGTSTDEADMALNTKFTWNTNGNDFDVETVYLHENGHVLGLGHSNVAGSVMESIYAGERRSLHQDDIDGISTLYPAGQINNLPTVTITSPADSSTFDSGATISFAGSASDVEDGDLTAGLVWNSSIDGQIGTGGSFSTTLSDGNHDITASVTDGGARTGTDSVSITVGTVNLDSTTVSVDSIQYATEGGKNGDKHLLITLSLVDDSNNAVSGASVSIDLYRDSKKIASGTGTTGSSGTLTFSLKNAAPGYYTTDVTSVTASGLEFTNNDDDGGYPHQPQSNSKNQK